jgi:phosphoserine phosphatase
MTHVATLVATTDPLTLTDALLARLAARLPNAAPPVWLDTGIAADIGFVPEAGDPAAAVAALRAELGALPVDVVVQPATGRRKKLLLADMDSTMIGQECIDELADFVGLKPQVAAITERAMRGEIAFEPALRERVALLAGLDADVIETVIADRITLTLGGRRLVSTMRAHGAYAALVSGGFTAFTEVVAAKLGFDETRANRLLVADGKLAGAVAEPILGREAKLAALRELRKGFGLAPEATLAVGDGANDLAMLQEAGLGVAFHAKPAVAAAAHARIDHSDLRALLYIQGYTRAEFADV